MAVIRLLFLLCFCFALAQLPALSAPPVLTSIYPNGGQVGTETKVTLTGTFDPWPVQVWTDSPEITAAPSTNKGQVTLSISTNALPGPYLLRLFNDEGASAPRPIMIGTLPEMEEIEPNGFPHEATAVTNLPIVLNGRFSQGGDSDTFVLHLTAGRTFVARLHGYGLGAPMDPILHLVNPEGVRVAFSHDDWNIDPVLVFPVETTGTYYLRVMAFAHPAASNVQFTSGVACIYRITLSEGPSAAYLFPFGYDPAIQYSVAGWNLQKTNLSSFITITNRSPDFTILNSPDFPDPLRLVHHAGPLALEIEPNNTKTNAQPLAIPSAITGQISSDDDLDIFSFQAKKDQHYQINLYTGHLGFPMNAVFRIEDEPAKTTAQSNITDENRDPKLNWLAPRDDTFYLSLRDLRDRGATNFFYHLVVYPTPPSFEFPIQEHAFTFEPGKTNDLKLKIERKHGFNQKISFTLEPLPPHLTLLDTELPADKSELTLKVVVPADAPALSAPFRLKATSLPEEPQTAISAYATFNLRGGDEEHAGHHWVDHTDQLWLTIPPLKN